MIHYNLFTAIYGSAQLADVTITITIINKINTRWKIFKNLLHSRINVGWINSGAKPV